MLAIAVMILGIAPMGFSPNIYFTYAAAIVLSIGMGFRIFLTVPTSIGFLLATSLLWLVPLHGK